MIPKLSGATHAMLNNLKLFTRVASLSLLLTPVKAWSEWRVPERVEIVLGTETLASERQAVLVLSAVVGSNFGDRTGSEHTGILKRNCGHITS